MAIDAERASGYRYSARAYLVQLRREGSGTALVDPIAFDDLTTLQEALGDTEWILHAATQDLACLAEVGLRPTTLFDTELAGRLLGYPRVGLATLVETVVGRSLRKEHSAVDWSTRPLPEPWLEYAALDVEALVELREALGVELEESGKAEWARQEFAHLVDAPSHRAPRVDPWRRTSGMHRARGRRALAAVRELWETRDEIAARRDVTPGRIIPDSAIVEAANAMPRDKAALLAAPRASAAAAPSATPTSGSRRCASPAPCPTRSCPRSPRGTTARRRPAPGPTVTRSRRPGWPRPASRSRRSSERARPPGGEPAHPGLRAPGDVGAAGGRGR